MHQLVKCGDQTVVKSLVDPAKSVEIMESVLRQHRSIIECNQRLIELLSCASVADALKEPAADAMKDPASESPFNPAVDRAIRRRFLELVQQEQRPGGVLSSKT